MEEHSPANGIYQIIGEMYPAQVMVLNALDEAEFIWPFSPFLSGRVRQNLYCWVLEWSVIPKKT